MVSVASRTDVLKIRLGQEVCEYIEKLRLEVTSAGEPSSVVLSYGDALKLFGASMMTFVSSLELIGGLHKDFGHRVGLTESHGDIETYEDFL